MRDESIYFPLPTIHGVRNLELWGYLAQLPPNVRCGSILDIGCGGGRIATWLAVRNGWTFKRVLGVDALPHMIHQFQANIQRYNLFEGSEVRLHVQDFRTLPFPDHSIDFVTSITALHYEPKAGVKQVFTEIKRVLKPGGMVCLLYSLFLENEYPEVIWTRKEAEALCEQVGLDLTDYEISPSRHNYLDLTNKAFRQMLG